MCAILDANAAHQVLGNERLPAGDAFRRWLDDEGGKLVVGGELRGELYKAGFGKWLQNAIVAGNVKSVNDEKVNRKTETLREQCQSDDPHVIALAQIGGARLLYSNDAVLHRDFKDRKLIDNPRGKIYSTLRSGKATRSKEVLLRKTDCPD